MMMVEVTSVPSAALPVAELADYLRLSSGFADDGSQDARLEMCLRAACAAIEARIGKALFQRDFVLTLEAWGAAQALPIAPVDRVNAVKIIGADAGETLLDPGVYALRKDAHRPRLVSTVTALPSLPQHAVAEISLTAGFAADWYTLPADLQQAVLALAAEYYSQDATAPLPGPVAAILQAHRPLRIGAGA